MPFILKHYKEINPRINFVAAVLFQSATDFFRLTSCAPSSPRKIWSGLLMVFRHSKLTLCRYVPRCHPATGPCNPASSLSNP